MLKLSEKKTATAGLSVLSNSLLIAFKVVVGLLTGSVAVLSEAIHSGVDLLAALIAFLAVKASGREADEGHPYGHGKFENLSGTIEAVLIFAAAVWIIYEAVKSLVHPEAIRLPVWGVGVMLVSAIVNYFVSRRLFKVADETDSVALRADGWHLRTDVYTSVGVMVGLLIIWVGGLLWPGTALYWLDPMIAIGVAVMIMKAAWDLTKESGRDLLDVALPEEELSWIKGFVIERWPQVLSFHDVRGRKAGPTRFIDFHVAVDEDMPVGEAHALAEDIVQAIRERMPDSEIQMHIDPCDGSCSGSCLSGCAADTIVQSVRDEGGRVTMARFIELALTHPTEGYYRRSGRILGPYGDFSTAPTLSTAFNSAVGRLVDELLDGARTEDPEMRHAVVELGGGEGQTARAIVEGWRRQRPELREKVTYCIVEVGEGMRVRQEAALKHLIASGWDIRWGEDLVEACAGTKPVVVLGNEFVDALPVHLVRVSGDVCQESWVAWQEGEFKEEWGPLSPAAEDELVRLFGTADGAILRALTDDGVIELRPAAADLLATVARMMPAGSFVTIDYGDWYGLQIEGRGHAPAPGEEPVVPPLVPAPPVASAPTAASQPVQPCACVGTPAWAQRKRTLRGYFHHQMSHDPVERVGHQDLTADVDFSALDFHGAALGFETVVFTTLADALTGLGAGTEALDQEGPRLSSSNDVLEVFRQAEVLQSLLDPSGLGEAYKLMIQVRE